MTVPLEVAAFNLCIALSCGAIIGSERQVRQRMAGLRTNALVALGAAAFVIFSQLVPNEVSPTRVAAQVVSGIGFLGAGIIFRDGFNVHGLNTAATLWCAAAVGLVAGIGAWPYALLVTALVVFINLGLRPLVKWIKKHTKAGDLLQRTFRIDLGAPKSLETAMRANVLRVLPLHGLIVTELSAKEDAETIVLTAIVHGEGVLDVAVEQAVARLGVESGITMLRWQAIDDV